MTTACTATPAKLVYSPLSAKLSVPSRHATRITKSKPATSWSSTAVALLAPGMEELYQITAALKHLSYGKHVALITDARFSGVSTGACIGHVGPEALAGGPIGRVREGDLVEIIIDRTNLTGSINLVGEGDTYHGADWGTRELEDRPRPDNLAPHPQLPDDSRLWAALQAASGGIWGGCVFDTDSIIETLNAGREALQREREPVA